MRHSILLIGAALALAAACDSPSGSSGPLRVAIAGASNDQQAVVGQPLPAAIAAVVTDAKGKPVANHTVTWTVLTERGGTPAPATSTTDAQGRATTVWTLGTRAGVHRLQVSAGDGGGMDTAQATAVAGPAVSAAVANHDTVQTLNPGQAVQLPLTAVDQYGNPVAAGGITATWTSRAAAIATAAGGATGTVTGQAPGRTVVDVAVPGGTLRVHVSVRGLAQSASLVNDEVAGIHGAPGRMLATTLGENDGRALWERTTGAWARVPGMNAYERQVRVLPGGEGWANGTLDDALGSYGTYRSTGPGAPWARVATPALPNAITSAGSTVFIAQYGGGVAATAFRRDGDGWTPIPSPAAADSAVAIAFLAASGASDLLLGGSVSPGAGGGAAPYLARWNGAAATRIAMPGGVTFGAAAQTSLLAASGTGAAYAVITPDITDFHTRLLAISGTTATAMANPVEQAGLPIRGIAFGPDGALYIAGEGMVARYAGGAWQSWTLRDFWTVQGGLYVDDAGRIWAGGMQHSSTYGILMLELIQ